MQKVLVMVILLMACRNELFMSQIAVDINFDQYQTYAFLPGQTSVSHDDDIIRFRSIQILKEEMDTRGFELDVDSPDFLVQIHTFFSSANDPTRNPEFRSPDDGPGPRFYFEGQNPSLVTPSQAIPNIQYAPGTIALAVIDAVDGSMIWNAWSQQPISPNALPEDLENYLGFLLEKFPVGPK